jgi:beta-lactamase class A
MKKIIISGIVFLLLGAAIGYVIGFNRERSVSVEKLDKLYPIRLNSSLYKFTNPLLAYLIPSADNEPQWASLKSKISDVINASKQKGLTRASVFMYSLNQGRWIGVNENETYPPASMFKVIIMIAYLKGEEQSPELLNEKLIYTKELNQKVSGSTTSLQIGESYIVSDLINKMIIDSDNGAEVLLLNYMDRGFFNSLFTILGIKDLNTDGSFFISPRQYSLFFRIIYNATYLNIDLSEKALAILSQTKFNEGIVAGVPSDVVVAHKFGEYSASGSMQAKDVGLHDCGIVYYPSNPYFLCVMTDGNDFNELKSVIKNISSLIYQNYQAN